MLVKESDTVTLLIISVIFRYFQLNFLFPVFLSDMNQEPITTHVFVTLCILNFVLVWFRSF